MNILYLIFFFFKSFIVFIYENVIPVHLHVQFVSVLCVFTDQVLTIALTEGDW